MTSIRVTVGRYVPRPVVDSDFGFLRLKITALKPHIKEFYGWGSW